MHSYADSQPGPARSVEDAVNRALEVSGWPITCYVINGGRLTANSPYAEMVPVFQWKRNIFHRLLRKRGVLTKVGERVSPGMGEFIVVWDSYLKDLPSEVALMMLYHINLNRPAGAYFAGFCRKIGP